MKDNRIFIDNATGETFTAQDLKRELLADLKRLTPAQRESLEEFERIKSKDGFVQVLLDGISTLEKLKPATLARLLYLSTHIQYNSGLVVNKKQAIPKGQLCLLLGISHTTASEFIDEVILAGILSVKADGCYISKEYIRYGNAGKKKLVRVYRSAYRSLYENTPAAKHVYIGYILRLMPLVDTETNIICGKPQKRVGASQGATAHIKPITFKEVCKAIDYNTSALNKLLDEISQLEILCNGNREPLVFFTEPRSNSPPTEWYLTINPHFFYTGADIDRIKIINTYTIGGKK